VTEAAPVAAEYLDPSDQVLFPRLTDRQIDSVAAVGSELQLPTGAPLFDQGQRDTPLYVVRTGTIDIIERRRSLADHRTYRAAPAPAAVKCPNEHEYTCRPGRLPRDSQLAPNVRMRCL
jgi:hypothetical protein